MLDEIIKRVHNLTVDQQKELLSHLKNLTASGKRGYSRKKIQMGIDGVAGEKIVQSSTKDISASGVFIKGSGPFETGKEIRVVFSLPDSNKTFKLKGSICRVEKDGFAVQFKELSPYSKSMLDQIIWDNASSD